MWCAGGQNQGALDLARTQLPRTLLLFTCVLDWCLSRRSLGDLHSTVTVVNVKYGFVDMNNKLVGKSDEGQNVKSTGKKWQRWLQSGHISQICFFLSFIWNKRLIQPCQSMCWCHSAAPLDKCLWEEVCAFCQSPFRLFCFKCLHYSVLFCLLWVKFRATQTMTCTKQCSRNVNNRVAHHKMSTMMTCYMLVSYWILFTVLAPVWFVLQVQDC